MKTPSSYAATLLLAGGLSLGPDLAEAAGPKVAVAQIKGSRKTAPEKFATGLRAGLRASGATVMEVGAANPKDGGFLDEAKEAGADYLVVVRLRYSRKRRFATAQMFDLESGEKLQTLKRKYRRASGAGKVGSSLGQKLGGAAAEAIAARRPAPITPKAAAAPPPAPKKARVEPKPDVDLETDGGPSFSLGGKEDAVVHLSLGAGTQVSSAYTVAVGGEVTGLAYTLNPLFMTAVSASVQAPTLGIGGEVWLSYVPVKYTVDVSPAVTPRDPSGRFISVGGAAKYRLGLAEFGDTGGLYLTPLLGVNYSSMTVEGQGENTVVVSYSNVDLQGGLRIGIGISEDLIVDFDTRVGVVLTYDEGPTSTGESGSGFNLRVGGGVRYWINDIFGVHGGLAYTYQRVSMSGLGTRVTFQDDPQLLDASVFNGDFKLFTGVQVAL